MSGSLGLKKQFGGSINKLAQERALDAVKQQGKCLPCQVVSKRGSIVKVKFNISSPFTLPEVVIPHFGPTYIRYPTQVGDLGITLAADVQIGSISGLGGGTPDMTRPGNLTPLFFMPLANANWSLVSPNVLFMHGPQGVTLQDTAGTCTFALSPAGITIAIGGMTLLINAAGISINHDINVTGGAELRVNTHTVSAHVHTDPQGGVTSPPVSGT